MTAKELNRDIKWLRKKAIKWAKNSSYSPETETALKMEYRRIYYADPTFEYLNRKSIITMIRLNLSLRVITFHHFGINIDLTKI